MRWLRSAVQALCFIFLLSFFSPLHSQELPPAGELVRLFLDCQGGGCRDMDFFRTEIQFVNWVRDRRDADVHLLITSQATGGGGRSYSLLFEGRERFQGMRDTLNYVSAYDATADEVREGLARIIKIGLMRYVGLTSAAERIAIGLEEAPREERPAAPGGAGTPSRMAAPEDDPWNFWVFRVGLNGNANGEQTFRSVGLTGSFTASRTTEEWKASFRLRSSYNESKFDYEEVSTLSATRSHSFDALLVRSVTDHWSAGLRGGVSSSTFTNHRLTLSTAPVLEYNLFPYSESTRRMLTLQYALEGSYRDYVEETIYFKTKETLLSQSLGATLSLRQPWGSTNLYLSAGHFLRDIGQHHASIGGSVNVRLARGLSLNLAGSVSRIQDRISVPAGEASVTDVLLKRKQLQTDYEYFTFFGLSYTFGSVFNNIVNPRIEGGGGGGEVIIMM